MPSFWEVEAEYAQLAEQIESAAEAGQEPPPEAAEAVRMALVKAEEKRDAFAGFVRKVEAYAEHCRAEAKRHQKKAQSAENLVERLKRFALDTMTTLGTRKLSGCTARFSVVDNSKPSLVLLDESQVPAEFWREETSRYIDKDALAAAIENGEVPESVAMVVRGQHLRIS